MQFLPQEHLEHHHTSPIAGMYEIDHRTDRNFSGATIARSNSP